MKKQVAKSQIFTKESLARIQDKMRNCCIKSFNKVYEQEYQLKTKEKGINQDIPVSQMQNYNEVKKQYEKNKKLLEQANKKTDLVNENGNNIKEMISNLKPNLVNKKNYTISKQQKEINVLKPFKYLWNKLMKFIKNKVTHSKSDIYKKVYQELKIDNILRQEDIDFINNKSTKKRNYEL